MNNRYLFKAALLASVLLGSTSAFAQNDNGNGYAQVFPNVVDPCITPDLVLNLYAPGKYGAHNGDKITECIDVPVALDKMHVVLNLDVNTKDGSKNSVGLKHMVFLATAIKDRIMHDGVDPANVMIVGILHGTAAGWGLKTPDLLPDNSNKAVVDDMNLQHSWMEKIFALAHPTDGSPAINIQLEICGVTMMGNGWTKSNLYTYDASGNPDPVNGGRILVNQGAIGRIIDLEQHNFTYIHEGYEDRD
jgi:hypothetical protein